MEMRMGTILWGWGGDWDGLGGNGVRMDTKYFTVLSSSVNVSVYAGHVTGCLLLRAVWGSA